MAAEQGLAEDVEAVSADVERLLGRLEGRVAWRAKDERHIGQAHVDRLATLRDRMAALYEMVRVRRVPTQEELKAAGERWAP